MRKSILALATLACALSFSLASPNTAQAYSWSAGENYVSQGAQDLQCRVSGRDWHGNLIETCMYRQWNSFVGTAWGYDSYGNYVQSYQTWWYFQWRSFDRIAHRGW